MAELLDIFLKTILIIAVEKGASGNP